MQLTETGQTVYDRTYSRTKPDGAKETWPETVQRVVDGNLILGGGTAQSEDSGRASGGSPAGPKHLLPDERERLIELMTEFKIIPAGRHLWATGVAGRQFLMNCWVSGWTEDIWEHFRFTFLRLMEGGGVGANYSNRYLNDYPKVRGLAPMGASDWMSLYEPYRVHVVCDPEHPDYQKMKDAGVLSEEYDHEWAGSFEVEDSREGWADALVDLVQTYYRDAKNVNRVFDVSRVRAEGARLKTFGGRASGPLPLAVMLHEVADVLNSRIGQPLDGISAMEIDHAIAKCVVSGGNRRSARMSIMHWADPQIEDFIACKIVSGSHWTTNISVEVDNDFFRLLDGDQTVGPYDGWYGVGWRGEYTGSQWADNVLNLITEGMLNNGEPGFWNSSLSNVNEPNWVACTNPCTTRNTWVQTATGPRRVEDLIGEPFIAIVDGKPYNSTSEGFFKTGHKPVYRLDTDEGWSAEVTSNHEVYLSDGSRVEVQYLTPGDNIRLSDHREVIPWTGAGSEIEGYTLGWLIGDGTFGPNAILQSQGKPETERSRKEMEKFVASLPHRSDFEGWAGPYTTGQYRMGTKALNEVAASWGIVKGNKTITDQVEQGCFQFYRGVLRGLFDTDGHPEYSPNAGVSVRLSSSDYGMLLAVQRMLSRMGIRSSVRLMHGAKDMVCPNTGNTYESKPSFRLLVTNRDNVQRFVDIIGFWHTGKDDRVQTGLASYKTDGYKTKFQATFRDLTYIRDDDVFDCTIPGPYDFCGNGIYMRDCGEIPLEAWEPCNLGHVNLAAFVDPDTGYVDPEGLTDAHELMTRFLIRATFADVTDPKSREVLDRNRRIGVGHLGVASFLAMTGHRFSEAPDSGSFTVFLDRLAGVVDTAAINYAHDLRIPVPVKTRTVAPTGTIAKMPGVSEGIHPIFSKYFVRRIRFSDVDPDQVAQVEKYRAQGYHTEPCQYAPATTVVSIPTKDSLVEAVERIYGEDGADYLVESADDLTLEEMIRFQAMYQTYWADNAVSFTANIDPGEYTPQYLAQLIAFHGEGLKGLTCFPDRSMPQSPYERISKEEYESFASTTISDGVDEDCASGSCPVR